MDDALILRQAADLLSNQSLHPIHLTPIDVYSTWVSRTWRCRVSPESNVIPPTLIVKHTIPRPEPSYADWHIHALLNDWAAGRFLGQISSHPPLAPKFYAGSLLERILVMEDLGTGSTPNTYELLLGSDIDQARQSLVEHVALLGRLHAETSGIAQTYLSIRNTLGAQEPEKPLYCHPWSRARLRTSTDDELQAAVQRYRTALQAVGIAPVSGVEAEIALVTAEIEEQPGPFLAYCKGDQEVPSDVIRCGSDLRLFDFNVGGLRHALVEGMPGQMTWGCHMRLPHNLVLLLEQVYQREFARGCPIATNGTVFQRAFVLAAARWHLFHVTWRLSHALQADTTRGPTGTTLRQQFLAWTDAFVELASDYGYVPNLVQAAARLAARLREAWPSETHTLPYYPIFQSTKANLL